MTPIEPPKQLLHHLREADRFLLVGHVNPDGDSIGSALGLASLLGAMGKSCQMWNRDETPAVYKALPGEDRIKTGPHLPFSDLHEKFDFLVTLECPSLDRTGLEQHLSTLPTLNMDHHPGNVEYGLVDWVDPGAPALGEMIFTLSDRLAIELGADAATVLLVALSSDTGGFRFANATPRAFDAGGRMVQAGADPTEVSKWLHESQPEPTVRLLGEMLQSLLITPSRRVASVLLTSEMFRNAEASPAHSEGLINHPRSIAGVEAVALARELGSGKCKVSLRSRGPLNVEQIARRHSGGGHRNAAGYVATGSPEEVREAAVAEIVAEMENDEL